MLVTANNAEDAKRGDGATSAAEETTSPAAAKDVPVSVARRNRLEDASHLLSLRDQARELAEESHRPSDKLIWEELQRAADHAALMMMYRDAMETKGAPNRRR